MRVWPWRACCVTGCHRFWKSARRGWRCWEPSIVGSSIGTLRLFSNIQITNRFETFWFHLRHCLSRFHSFLLFLGYSRAMVRDTKAEDFCKTISDFTLEYRSTRQAILLQRERERQRSGAESPGPNTPVGRRKRQQTPSRVFISVDLKVKLHSGRNCLFTCFVLIHQENEEQCRLEEVLRTPELTPRLDHTLPRNRRRMADIQST